MSILHFSSSAMVSDDKPLEVRKVSHVPSELDIIKEAKSLVDQNKSDWTRHFCFVIFNGKTLRNIAEFRSFQRNFALSFNVISRLIDQLEELLRNYKIRLAVIDGLKLQKLGIETPLPDIDSLFECITNKLQLKLELYLHDNQTYQEMKRSAIIIQGAIRLCLYRVRKGKRFKLQHQILLIQRIWRGFLCYRRLSRSSKSRQIQFQNKWERNQLKLKKWYGECQNNLPIEEPETIAVSEEFEKLSVTRSISQGDHLIVYVPSSSSQSSNENQEPFLLALQLLYNSKVKRLIYVLSEHLNIAAEANVANYFKAYSKASFLNIEERIIFVRSEASSWFQDSLKYSSALLLWCSTKALKKVSVLVNEAESQGIFPMIMSSDLSQTSLFCISNYLDVPVFGASPLVADHITRPLRSHQLFTDAKCRVLTTSHAEIRTESDLLMALAKLIACDIQTDTWIITISTSSVWKQRKASLNIKRISICHALRKEYEEALQNANIGSAEDSVSNSWFSKSTQLDVRRRLLLCLRKELPDCVTIHRHQDSLLPPLPQWTRFLSEIAESGCIIEAELKQQSFIGSVSGLCFVSPVGNILYLGGCDHILVDSAAAASSMLPSVVCVGSIDKSTVGFIFEKRYTPSQALEGVMTSICKKLFDVHGIYGHVTVQFASHWGSAAKLPRLSALRLSLGLTDEIHTFATIALSSTLLSSSTSPVIPKKFRSRKSRPSVISCAPVVCLGLSQSISRTRTPSTRNAVFLKYIHQNALRFIRSERFTQSCRAKGIFFDKDSLSGCLFFSSHALCRDNLSCLTIGSSRSFTLELALRGVLAICQLQYAAGAGGSSSAAASASWPTESNTLAITLRKLISREEEELAELINKWT